MHDRLDSYFGVPDSAIVRLRLAEELVLDAYGYRPVHVEGGGGLLDGSEVWTDLTGALFTRAAALAAIQSLVKHGYGQPFPEEWTGPLDGEARGP